MEYRIWVCLHGGKLPVRGLHNTVDGVLVCHLVRQVPSNSSPMCVVLWGDTPHIHGATSPPVAAFKGGARPMDALPTPAEDDGLGETPVA